MLRAVLIDLGDTLVHLDRPWEDVFQANLEAIYAYLKKSGLNSDFQGFVATFVRIFEDASAKSDFYKIEIPMQDIISTVLRKLKFRNPSEDLIRTAMEEFYGPEIKAWQVYPDTIPTLIALRDDGFEMGLISNAKSDWAVHAILEQHSLQKFFNVILTSAALRIRKPRAEIFTRALKALDVKPSETVFLGDSLQADIIGARTLGIRSIHLLRRPVEPTNLVDPEVTVSSLSEALDQITEWKNSLSNERKVQASLKEG